MTKIKKENKMFLYLFDDGSMTKGNSVEEDDLEACDDGLLSIVDITDSINPLEYVDGSWVVVESVDQGD